MDNVQFEKDSDGQDIESEVQINYNQRISDKVSHVSKEKELRLTSLNQRILSAKN